MLRTIGNLQQPVVAVAERLMSRFKPGLKPDIPAVPFEPIPPSTNLDQVISDLHDRAQAWAKLNPTDRAALLRECISTTLEVAEEAATAATQYKGSSGGGIGEEL